VRRLHARTLGLSNARRDGRTERDAIGIPLTRWESIAGAMAAEQSTPMPRLVADDRAVAPRGRAVRVMRLPMRAAAGFLLLAGGAIAGRLSAGAPLWPLGPRHRQWRTRRRRDAQVASLGSDRSSMTFASVEDARATQLRLESMYQQAASYLAEHDSAGARDYSPEMVKTRLAALDQMIPITREAMREAPHDPVMNSYYLTTVGQREAALRQLNIRAAGQPPLEQLLSRTVRHVMMIPSKSRSPAPLLVSMGLALAASASPLLAQKSATIARTAPRVSTSDSSAIRVRRLEHTIDSLVRIFDDEQLGPDGRLKLRQLIDERFAEYTAARMAASPRGRRASTFGARPTSRSTRASVNRRPCCPASRRERSCRLDRHRRERRSDADPGREREMFCAISSIPRSCRWTRPRPRSVRVSRRATR
jgi:hypothetical protein